jgi:hypothetical protein
MHMKFRVVVALATLALVAGAVPPSNACRADVKRCSCTTANAPLASFVHAVAGDSGTDSLRRNGVFLDATLRSAGYTDSITIGGRSRPDITRAKLVREFAVIRSWARPNTQPPPTVVRFYDPWAGAWCPPPGWEVGKRYLIFAVTVRDTLRAWAPCGRLYPIDSADTRAAISALDTLFTRR